MPYLLSSFGVGPFVVAGVTDTMSPCMLAVLVFFVAFLFYWGHERKELFISASFFITGLFFTIIFLNLGFLEDFCRSPLFLFLTKWVYGVVGGVAVIGGLLSVRDWYVFRGTKSMSDVVFPVFFIREVPASERPVHGWLWLELILTSLLSGFIVAIGLSRCGAQNYLIATVQNLLSLGLALDAFVGLSIYAFMMIMPLGVLGGIVSWILNSPQRINEFNGFFSMSRVVAAAVFLGLGIGLWVALW